MQAICADRACVLLVQTNPAFLYDSVISCANFYPHLRELPYLLRSRYKLHLEIKVLKFERAEGEQVHIKVSHVTINACTMQTKGFGILAACIGLYGKTAPGTVENFLKLVRSGALQQTTFSKVLPGEYIQV